MLTPAGDVLHVGHGVLDPPLLRAQDDAVEIGVDDRGPQALELGDEPAEQVQKLQSRQYRVPEDTVRKTAHGPEAEGPLSTNSRPGSNTACRVLRGNSAPKKPK